MPRKLCAFVGIFLFIALFTLRAEPTKVACVGDSITAGAGTLVSWFNSYPAQLQRLLGPDWQVKNFGVSGSTLLKSGDKPYQSEKALAGALAFDPNIVVIMLGTNDSKPQNWPHKDQFIADYKDLIGKFKALPTNPKIYICLPVPVIDKGNYGINEPSMQEERPMISQIAKEENVSLIDMNAAFAGKGDLFPDRVHPKEEGAAVLAQTAYTALTGKPAPEVPKEASSEWSGGQRVDFSFGRRVGTVVIPAHPLPGHPWIWRTEFFGAFPSVDQALLKQGFYIAYVGVSDLFGAPVALDTMDEFYAAATKKYGLAAKVVLEGFSRGGLYAFNWAARHPDETACIYGDAPVCDFKSWPGGKGKAKPDPGNWERCKKAYGFTEEQALAYKLNPVDNLKPLADAKIPIVLVYGEADTDVPPDENALLLASRYKELGGDVLVIGKPGVGHHPHSLADPKQIVDFILAHSGVQ